ncbi:MAG: hypothetical protein C7B46_16320 [Sulfobacillus benefaciens]|uniref:Uncharacterized protein n=1 Tax=Sulfobacillus benefaciens TaxID=453960 RepID=A0A2T2XBV2_9FIRM|nr:MAG: hypothetical protein C7B46_16320 [Sulfobacillus benefaciens]
MDIFAVGLMAILGLLLTPIPWSFVVLLLGLTLVYLLLLDVIKVPIMSKIGIQGDRDKTL